MHNFSDLFPVHDRTSSLCQASKAFPSIFAKRGGGRENLWQDNTPCLIYHYFNMDLRLSGQNCNFFKFDNSNCLSISKRDMNT